MEQPSGPELLAAEALSHKCCTPSTPFCSTPYPPKSVLILCLGTGGSVCFNPYLVSSCPKGRTVHLAVLEVSLTLRWENKVLALIELVWKAHGSALPGQPLCCYGTCFGLLRSDHDSCTVLVFLYWRLELQTLRTLGFWGWLLQVSLSVGCHFPRKGHVTKTLPGLQTSSTVIGLLNSHDILYFVGISQTQ